MCSLVILSQLDSFSLAQLHLTGGNRGVMGNDKTVWIATVSYWASYIADGNRELIFLFFFTYCGQICIQNQIRSPILTPSFKSSHLDVFLHDVMCRCHSDGSSRSLLCTFPPQTDTLACWSDRGRQMQRAEAAFSHLLLPCRTRTRDWLLVPSATAKRDVFILPPLQGNTLHYMLTCRDVDVTQTYCLHIVEKKRNMSCRIAGQFKLKSRVLIFKAKY